MDAGSWGLIGGIIGTAGGCLGGWFGARASYKAAANEAQRNFYRRIFAWLVPIGLLFIVLVWLVAVGILPYWVYVLVMIAWFAPLGPGIVWTNRRLTALASQPDPRS